MTRFVGLLLGLGLAWPICGAGGAFAEGVQTHGDCSPVVIGTLGNVIINQNCPLQFTPIQLQELIDSIRSSSRIPPELMDRYDHLREQFGVTDRALRTFLQTLGKQNVPVEDLDKTLREIAAYHLALLSQVNALPSDDPRIEAIKQQATAAINAGDYEHAEVLLADVEETARLPARHLEEAQKRLEEAREKQLLTAAAARATRGGVSLTRLDYAAAAEHFRTAAALVPDCAPERRADYLGSWGEAAWRAGHYPEAQGAQEEALALRERALGGQLPAVAQSLNNLAVLYRTQGRFAEAEPLFQRALAIWEPALGPQHLAVAAGLNNLAGLYQDQGRWAEAEPLYQRALAIVEQILAPQHPDVATCLNNLALLYHDQGRSAEAEPLLKRALAILEQALGPQHPDVANSLNNLALLYRARGRWAEAEPLYQRAWAS